MSFISTASSFVGGTLDFVNTLSPLLDLGINVAGLFGAGPGGGGGGGGGGGRRQGATAAPGGAPLIQTRSPGFGQQARSISTMPQLPTSPMMAQQTLGSVNQAIDFFQGQQGLVPTGGGGAMVPRNPKIVHVPKANGRGLDVYVKAPQAIYKVTVRSPRRCHRGPR